MAINLNMDNLKDWSVESQDQKPKILDEVRDVMRLHHYSIHTERTYLDWIKQYIGFHRMKSRNDLAEGEKKIEAFLTHLAVDERVAAATQNNALVFLYKRVLEQPLDETIHAVRAEKKLNVPVVLTREKVMKAIPLMDGVSQLIVKLLYGRAACGSWRRSGCVCRIWIMP